MSSAAPDAGRVRALVVGIAEYPVWPDFERKGLDEDAVRFARWLRRSGVPADNIELLLSPPRTDLPDGLVCADRPSGADKVREVLTDLLAADGDVLWVFWAGHGYQNGIDVRMIMANARPTRPTNISFGAVTTSCTDRHVKSFRRQVFVVDACRMDAARIADPDPVQPWIEPLGRQDSIGQTILYACARGESASYSTEQRGGLFSKLVLAELEGRGPSFAADPDSAGLVTAVMLAARGEGGIPNPTSLIFQKDSEKEPTVIDVGRDGAEPVHRYDLGAFAAGDWKPLARNEGCGSAAACRLDVAWCLDRTRVRAVLADHADADLGFELNVVEQQIAGTTEGPSPVREWRSIDVTRPFPADLAEVLACSRQGAAVPAVVLRVECAAPVHRDQQADEAVKRWAHALDRAVPGVDIVVQVAAEAPVDSVPAAQRTARLLRVPADGAEGRWPVFARNRPGTAPKRQAVTSSRQTPTIAAVLGHLRHQAALRGLDPPTWYPRHLGEDDHHDAGSLAAADAVKAVVRAADEVDTPDPEVESGLLCAVRDLAPQWYLPLLRAYAGRSRGPVWSAAAAVAAVHDADLDVWLEAAGGAVGPDLMTDLPESWLCDAMCLAHLRRGETDTAGWWGEQDVSRGVAELCSWTSRHPCGDLTMADLVHLDWTAVVPAPRAGRRVDFDPAGAPAQVWRSKELWAALAAHPVGPETLRVLLAVPTHLHALRAAVGMVVANPEAVLVEDVTRCRRVLRYVATRERDSA